MSKQSKASAGTNTPTPAAAGDNTQKDPSQWVTGAEPMTGAQRSYLKTLSQETGQEIEPDLTKAEASEKINELKQIDPRVAGQ